MLMDTNEYITFLESIKAEITQTRARAVGKVNSELICLYWRIGSELNSRKDWGASVIDTLSKDIRVAFPQIKGFSARNLRYMAKFARECNEEFLQTVSAKLSWSHTVKLMDKLKDDTQRHWYGKEAIENGWSLAVLDHQIDLKLYERQALSGKVSNFTRTLPHPTASLLSRRSKTLTSSTSSPPNKASRNTTTPPSGFRSVKKRTTRWPSTRLRTSMRPSG